MSTSTIEHSGIISEITDSSIFVKIISASACSSCHAKGMCSSSDMEEKIIEVDRKNHETYKTGDFVTVEMNQSVGTKAVLIGYLFPFFTLFAVFIIMMQFTKNEGIVAVVSLLSLIPYYLAVWVMRKKHKNNFQFRLKL